MIITIGFIAYNLYLNEQFSWLLIPLFMLVDAYNIKLIIYLIKKNGDF